MPSPVLLVCWLFSSDFMNIRFTFIFQIRLKYDHYCSLNVFYVSLQAPLPLTWFFSAHQRVSDCNAT